MSEGPVSNGTVRGDKPTEAFQRIIPLFETYRLIIHPDLQDESEQTDLGDLLADMVHFCDVRGLNMITALDAAQRHYMGDKAEQEGGDFSDATGLNDPDVGPGDNGVMAAQDLWQEGMAKSEGSADHRAAMNIAHVALGYRAARSGYTQVQYVEFYAGFLQQWGRLRQVRRAQR